MNKIVSIISILLLPVLINCQQLDIDGNVNISGTISGLSNPVNDQDAATKLYVDAIKTSLNEELLNAGLNGYVTDVDGNVYKTIKIGTQVWMAENLRTTRYNDGTVIPNITNDTEWSNLTSPAYCWYDNDSTLYAKLSGALYNFYAAADTNSLNVCPVGWHVPSDVEWTELIDYLTDNGYGFEGSGNDIAKSVSTTFRWDSSTLTGVPGDDSGTNNSSLFSAYPAGERNPFFMEYRFFGEAALFWSSTAVNNPDAWIRLLTKDKEMFEKDFSADGKAAGQSLRCVRD